MSNSRRTFLIQSVIACSGVIAPRLAFADWAEDHFAPGKLDRTLDRLYADATIVESDAIALKLPLIAEDGAVVPITVSSTLGNVESIAILVEKNPVPLAAIFNIAPETEPFVSAHLKMAETCDVIAVVKSGETLYSARQQVKVTIGGCGG
ncbi:thiosulfate oxidation carrier protein SoxY [Methylotuvimicrobium buryatense]|uniref:Thiosulfate oxidation carrier protein SoxY n=1 Tax=Methylotuvimicrobium buryatense TaxID=95641 RepID=A0A4P9UP86_METBY|nr:thiosulfate oxidation carrier protein SoxY [Methylotuvimicrobium buryatense]QCW82320.1 thiosulfate oxidation carrier protein SoxY [Methylotuvimicrobium buryatense]